MASILGPICGPTTACKCCGAIAARYGVVDFHKHCSIARGVVLEQSGIPIYYYRCPKCQFIFTMAFDNYTKEDFLQQIYNDSYRLVDSDYREVRPRSNADLITQMFASSRPSSIVDYGGGNGLFTERLREYGFPNVETYDPFVPQHATKPLRRFDCVVSFEVAEHSTDPVGTFAEMNELLTENGLLLFSTLLQPDDIDQQGLNWWYCGPRNGHVSLYSRNSLLAIAARHGFQFASCNTNLHVFFRKIPDFARLLIRRG